MWRTFERFLSSVACFKNWWVVSFDYFGLLRKRCITYFLRDNVALYATAGQNDGVIINEIWARRIYTPQSFAINEQDIVVDIGAHKGYFTIFAARRASKGKVYAFEPMKQNFSVLKKNIKLNRIKNVVCKNVAVYGIRGYRNFYFTKESTAGVSSNPLWFPNKRDMQSFKARCITLDDIFMSNNIEVIDFLKVDCEADEYEIFLHTRKEVLTKIKKISMEYHEIGDLRIGTLEQFLKENGFAVQTFPQERSIGMLYANQV